MAVAMRSGERRGRRADGEVRQHQSGRLEFLLASDMEEPLNHAISYGDALMLMGYGLSRIDADHGRAVIAIAEAITTDLAAVQNSWRQIMAASTHRQRARARHRRT